MKKIVLALLILASNAAMAQTPKVVVDDTEGWHKIGETTVNFKKETDKVMIVGANRFRSIKIKVTDAPIRLESFTIVPEHGDDQVVQVGQEFKTPGETKTVDFGKEKSIKRVEFKYKTLGDGDTRGKVEVWGYKTNEIK
jgi:hypothetical protein